MNSNKQRHLKPKNKNKDTNAFKRGNRIKGLMPSNKPIWPQPTVAKKMANNSDVNSLADFFNSNS